MNPCLLDTNILSHLFNNHPIVRRHVKQQRNWYGQVYISVVTYYEVYNGWSYYAHSTNTRERRLARNKLIDFEVFLKENALLNLTSDAVQYAGKIKAERRRKELPFNDDMDYLIAGTALSKGLTLVTRNVKDFSGIRDLKIENWIMD